MSPNEVAGYVALAGVVFKFLLDAYGKYTKARHDEAKAEAARIEARDKTQRENEAWLRAKVDQMLNAERADHVSAIALRDSRIEALEADVKMLATMFARGVDRTPTHSEWKQLQSIFARHNIHPDPHAEPAE
jgi:hypothetical protein